MWKTIGVVALLALGSVGCGGEVTQTEHDQALAELALAQQDLADARSALAAERSTGSEQSGRVDALEERIDQIIRDTGLIVGAQQDPLEELARLVADFHEREAQLMAELESIAGTTEFAERSAVEARLAGVLEVGRDAAAMLANDPPPSFQQATVLMNGIELADDGALHLAYQALADGYADASDARRRELIGEVLHTAMETGLALLP